MPSLKIETVSGLHPYGTLDDLYAFRSTGQKPYREGGAAECPAASFAALKALGPSLRRTPRLARLALAAALALPHFEKERDGETENAALVVATAYGSVASTFDFMDSLLADGPDMASPTAFSHSVANMTAAMLGQHLRLTGPAVTLTDAGGRPFNAALLAAAGILESAGANRVFLCVVEESRALMNSIVAAHSSMHPGLEGAVMFVLSRGVREAWPHVVVPPCEEAASRNVSPTIPAMDVHGPGPLAHAWNVALSFLALRNGGEAPIRCRASAETDGKTDIWLEMGTPP